MSAETKKVTAQANSQSLEFIGKLFRKGNGQPNPTGGVGFLIDSFKTIYRQNLINLKGKFEKNELFLMIDVMNGTMLVAHVAGQHLVGKVSGGIALDGIDKKWKIGKTKLMEKLMLLSIPELALFELWIQGFGVQSGDTDALEMEDYVKQLLEE